MRAKKNFQIRKNKKWNKIQLKQRIQKKILQKQKEVQRGIVKTLEHLIQF